MKMLFHRDYRNAQSGEFGFDSGIFQNMREAVTFRYLCFQVRGIGSLQFSWEVSQ